MNITSGVGSSGLGSLAGAPSASRPEGLPEDMQNRPGRDSNDAQVTGRNLNGALCDDVFIHIYGFLGPHKLNLAKKVCRGWNETVESPGQWENQCRILLGVETASRGGSSLENSKEVFQRLYTQNLFGKHFYERYLGSVGQVPPIPQHLSPLLLWNKPDPCDSSQTIGQAYVWVYMPSHFDVQVEKDGEVRTEKVPVTISNLPRLFAKPKEGPPSKYEYIWGKVTEQFGRTEHLGRWICMRREVFDRGSSWGVQKENALARGVIISQLVERILLNFLANVRSGNYLDGQNPGTFARTSTEVTGYSSPLGCGYGVLSGVYVYEHGIDHDCVGVAVALPEEVQAAHP